MRGTNSRVSTSRLWSGQPSCHAASSLLGVLWCSIWKYPRSFIAISTLLRIVYCSSGISDFKVSLLALRMCGSPAN